MAIADDFEIQGLNIRHILGTTNYSGIEFHRFLTDKATDLEYAGDDMVDITFDNPSKRKGTDNYIELLNGYNINDATSQFLYDASIVQNDGNDIYDSIVNYGTAGIYFDIIQNGALLTNFWGTGINADASKGISHRFLIKVRSGGVDIDGRKLLGINREFGYSTGEFFINGTSRGNNTLALKHSLDLNNQKAAAVVGAFTITNTEGYQGIDVDGNSTDEYYFSGYDRGTHAINDLYEYLLWQRRRGTSEIIYGLNGALYRGVTHDIVVDTPTGTFSAVEAVSWSGGTGQMLAINSTTAPTKMWIQLLTGIAPTDNQTITGGTSGATCLVNVTVTEHEITNNIATGSAIIGMYGLGIIAANLTKDDKLTDLTGTQNVPPNLVTYTVGNLLAGDSVLVGKLSAAYVDPPLIGLENKIDTSQFTLNGALSNGDTSVVINEVIGDDTPATGTLRIWNGTKFVRVTYTAWSGSTFTGCSGVLASNDSSYLWVSYIDGVSSGTTMTFSCFHTGTDLDLYVRVRVGGVDPLEEYVTPDSLKSTGGGVNIVRTSDL